MKTKVCQKCNHSFSLRGGNYNKHILVCDGSYTKDKVRGLCKHCNVLFDLSNKTSGWMANHSRWCESNPKSKEYRKDMSRRSIEAQKNMSIESRRRQSEGVKAAHKRGVYNNVARNSFLGKTHTEETKEKIKLKALSSNHRRLKKKMIWYKDILMDSSWEVLLAKKLDSDNINWVRPNPIKWIDLDGLEHNYFPDFYLLDYDVYLDPKNPEAYKKQSFKIQILLETYPNIIFLLTPDECKNFAVDKIQRHVRINDETKQRNNR